MSRPLPMTTRRLAQGQLVFCQGCCCGRTDRGKPDLPVEMLKEVWRAEKLNQAVHLTISGCLGPCDLTNVTLAVVGGEMIWLGGLHGEATYRMLIGWARECHAAHAMLPLPPELLARRFERYHAGVTA